MSFRGRSVLMTAAVMIAVTASPAAVVGQSTGPTDGAASPLAAVELPSEQALVPAGRYVSNVGTGTSVTFDLADGAWAGAGGPLVVLDRDVSGDVGEILMATFDSALADPCSRDVTATQPVAEDAAAFADWLVAQPWAAATRSDTTLGGEPAIQIDIPALTPACPGQPMFVWTYGDGGAYRLYPTEGVRVIAQDRGDDLILVTAETLDAKSLPAFLEVATPVIESMVFGAPIALASPAPSPMPEDVY